MRKVYFLHIILLTFVGFSCSEVDMSTYESPLKEADVYHQMHKKFTDIIVHDIFSPPVASRNYLYPNIAAYEILQQTDASFISLAGQLNGLTTIPLPDTSAKVDVHLAAVRAFLMTARNFVFSQDRMDAFTEEFVDHYKSKVPSVVWRDSESYAKQVSDHIMAWASQDMYKETRTYPKYTVMDEEWAWQPTPPSYMDGIEPAWGEIRTVVLDSAQQFRPAPPTDFSTDPNSQFYKEVMEVYEAVNQATQEQTQIAQFWDCNPYVSHHVGHVMYATKKITPGGHWMGIARLASKKEGLNMLRTSEVYTMTAIGLFDAFISCWDEKWRSILIRPETYINTYIDENWYPILQTPPFPEHTSGHSVVSSTSSILLTHLFGDSYAFEDSTEVEYGLPVRSYRSFKHAAEEAAISRLYGGIHYRPAIDEGFKQGKGIAELILERISTRSNSFASN